MRYLTMYNTDTKIVESFENYDEEEIWYDGRYAYNHNVRRYIAEAKNRGGFWKYFDDSSTFSSKFSGYSESYQPNNIVLIGDSRTALWDNTTVNPFSSYTTVDNRGIGGSSAEQQALWIPTWNLGMYEKAVISIGINDAYNNYSDTVYNIGLVVSHLKKKAKDIYLTNIPTVNDRLIAYSSISVSQFNNIYNHAMKVNAFIPTICANFNIHYIDLHGYLGMTGSVQHLKYEYSDESGIHFNDAGYQVIANRYTAAGI